MIEVKGTKLGSFKRLTILQHTGLAVACGLEAYGNDALRSIANTIKLNSPYDVDDSWDAKTT